MHEIHGVSGQSVTTCKFLNGSAVARGYLDFRKFQIDFLEGRAVFGRLVAFRARDSQSLSRNELVEFEFS